MSIVRLESLHVIVYTIWSYGTHVDYEGPTNASQISGFLAIVGHYRACTAIFVSVSSINRYKDELTWLELR